MAGPWDNARESDPRAETLRRFRNFALFWIIVLVGYFVGADLFLEATRTAIGDAMPVLALILGCILVATIWHAAAVVTMSLSGQTDRR
jgi:hypothetical protein